MGCFLFLEKGDETMSKQNFIGVEHHAVKDAAEAIRLCGEALVAKGYTDESFIAGCIEREAEYPTGLPSVVPVAIPHCQCDGIKESSICVLRLTEPVKFYRMDDASEHVETKLVFNLAIRGADAQLSFLQKLMAFVMDEEKVRTCETGSVEEMLQFVRENLL